MENIKITYLIYRLGFDAPIMTCARNDEQLEYLINLWTDKYNVQGTMQIEDDIIFVQYVPKEPVNVEPETDQDEEDFDEENPGGIVYQA